MRVMYKIHVPEFEKQLKELKKQKLLTVVEFSKKAKLNHNTLYNLRKNWEVSRTTLKKLLKKDVWFTRDIID